MLQTSMQPRLTYGSRVYDVDELGKLKMPKLLRKVGAVAAGATGGLVGIKPKALGVKSKSGKKWFRVGRAVGAVTLAVVAGPAVLAKMGPYMTKFSTALKSFAPKALSKLGPEVATHAMKTLTDKGIPQNEAARMIEAEAAMIVEADTAQQAATIAQAQTARASMMASMFLILGAGAFVAFTLTQRKG